MKTDGGWVSISECARLYGRHRKWVYDQIKRYGIETHKEGNRTRLRLVDLIQHRGEPQNGAPAHNETHTEESQKITPEVTPHLNLEAELVKQENVFRGTGGRQVGTAGKGGALGGGTVEVAGDYREADTRTTVSGAKGMGCAAVGVAHGTVMSTAKFALEKRYKPEVK